MLYLMTINKLAELLTPVECGPLASRTQIDTLCGVVSTRRITVLVPGLLECRDMEGFLIRGWDLNLPVSVVTSTLAGEATLATRWLHEPQPISNQPVWLGFPHRARQYRPGGSPFSTPGCWS